VHPGVGTVPAAFPIAERVGKVNGKEFLTAICLGGDVVIRLGYAGKKGQGGFKWLAGQVYGYFSATAACGRLLKLNADQLVDAFGIVLMQTGGTYEPIVATGGIVRGIWPAYTSHAGVLYALMAQKGIAGSKDSLEGKSALFQAFVDGKYDRNYLVDDLGKKFYMADSGFKPWPCSGLSKPHIEATLHIVNTNHIKSQDIDEITVFVSDYAKLLVEPASQRRNPQTTMDAKWSLPYIVSVAATKGKVGIGDFTATGIKNPDVLRLVQKVKYQYDPQLTGGQGGWVGVAPGRVEIKTVDGRKYTKQVDVALGYGTHPMSKQQHEEKFRDCAAYSAKPLSSNDINTVIQMVDNLEKVEDVSEIVRILS